jgi:Cu(I)/Ag(I) efflux system membrane fusion protein
MDRTGRAQSHLSLGSPVSGVVTELNVREGAQVTPGMTIAKVVGMDTIWLLAEIPETLINSARPGMSVSMYQGKVREILPGVSTATRTAQARLELDNKDGSLIPGMLMNVKLSAANAESRLLIPSEAIIASGRRTIVYLADEKNSMHPVVVSTGREIGAETEILSGLSEGQRVVASGQFLIDSEANLKSILPKSSDKEQRAPGRTNTSVTTSPAPGASPMPQMTATKPGETKKPSQAPNAFHQGAGRVEKITNEAITLSHGPIASLQWPAMTMDFNKPRPDSFKEIKIGQTVQFSFSEGASGYELVSVTVNTRGRP